MCDLDVYKLLFAQCDSENSGWVGVDALIDYVRKVLPENTISKNEESSDRVSLLELIVVLYVPVCNCTTKYTPNNIGQIRLVKTRHGTLYLGNDPVLYLTEIQPDSDPIF